MYAWFAREIGALPANEYLILCGLLLVGFLASGWYSLQSFRRFRHITATATSRIRSAAQGRVELKGFGEWLPNGDLHSPFSGSRCLWYHCSIDKKKRGGKRHGWTNIRDDISTDLFRLVDDTGYCVIDPEGAHVVPELSRTWYGNSAADSNRPPRKSGRLPGFSVGDYRFRERLIRPASQLYALGWFSTHYQHPADKSVDRQVAELLRQWKLQPGKYLRQFDIDADGRFAEDEWNNARAAARKEILSRQAAERQYQHLMAAPADRRQPYILSAIDEEKLVRHKKRKAHGAALAAFLLFSLLILMTALRSPLAV